MVPNILFEVPVLAVNLIGDEVNTEITFVISANIAASFFAFAFKRSSNCFKLEVLASTACLVGNKKLRA